MLTFIEKISSTINNRYAFRSPKNGRGFNQLDYHTWNVGISPETIASNPDIDFYAEFKNLVDHNLAILKNRLWINYFMDPSNRWGNILNIGFDSKSWGGVDINIIKGINEQISKMEIKPNTLILGEDLLSKIKLQNNLKFKLDTINYTMSELTGITRVQLITDYDILLKYDNLFADKHSPAQQQVYSITNALLVNIPDTLADSPMEIIKYHPEHDDIKITHSFSNDGAILAEKMYDRLQDLYIYRAYQYVEFNIKHPEMGCIIVGV